MSDSVELKPCPRCRMIDCETYTVRDDDDDEGGDAYVVCKCGLTGTLCSNLDEAAEWWNTRATDQLLDEMADVLEEIVNDARGYESRHGKSVSWRDRGEYVLQKYHDQQSLAHPNPQPPQP